MNKMHVWLLLLLLASNSNAVTTGRFHQNSQEGFANGELKNVSTTSDGHVLLSPLVEKLAGTDELYIWSLATDNKGNLYAGTGNEGKIYKVTGKKLSLLYDSPELEIQSLAVDKDDNVYAGTSPGGLIYKISPNGNVSTFCDLQDSHVWSLAIDDKGNLYAGTGDEGKIYRITAGGKITCLYDSNQSHILCLILDKDNNLYAGSEPDGIVYRITPQAKVSVLYDADETDIHTLALDKNNNIYAGTASGDTIPDKAKETHHQDNLPQNADQETILNSIYRIAPSGYISRLFRTKHLIICIFPDSAGNIYVGTGNEGLIYRISQDEKIETLFKTDELQVLSMVNKGENLLFGTGNMGHIYTIEKRYSGEGFLTSSVHDTFFMSHWGRISWNDSSPKGTRISFRTRTGNTQKPDDTWSEWSRVYSESSGQEIESPQARFVQYQAHLETNIDFSSPVLQDVTICYLTTNQPPEMSSLKIEGYKIREKSGMEGKKRIIKGEKKADWKAKDPNNDSLIYNIYYRGAREKNWKVLKEDVKKNSYCWDSVSFPDGYYLLKIVASDKPDNPPGKAMCCEKITEPFLVDNTPPHINDLKIAQGINVRGIACDNISRILLIEYSLDGGKWIQIFPEDDIFDSKSESFSFSLPPLSSGEHTVVVKITDAEGNVGTEKTICSGN